MTAIVYAPEHAPRAKTALIESLGAEVRLTGADLDEAKDAARAFAAASGLPFFEDGAEPAQYEGYRSIAREVLEQLGRAPAALVVPLGNGALLGGIGLELADRSPSTLAVGVQSREAPVMVECWQAGRVVESDRSETFADGLAVRVAIPHAVDVLARVAGPDAARVRAGDRGGRGGLREGGDPRRGRSRGRARGAPAARRRPGSARPRRHGPQHRRRTAGAGRSSGRSRFRTEPRADGLSGDGPGVARSRAGTRGRRPRASPGQRQADRRAPGRTPAARPSGRPRSGWDRSAARSGGRARTRDSGRGGGRRGRRARPRRRRRRSTISMLPSPRWTTPRSPSGPKRIGRSCSSRIWFSARVCLSVSASKAPSLKTLQFW